MEFPFSSLSQRPASALLVVALSSLALGGGGTATADEGAASAEAETEADATAAAEAAAEAAEPDPLTIPPGGPDEMLAFIRELQLAARKSQAPSSQRAQFHLQAFSTMLAAANQGLNSEPSESQAVKLTRVKLEALSQLKLISEIAERITVAEARRDERPKVASVGWRAYALDGAREWSDWNDVQRARWRQDLLDDWPAEQELAEVRAVALRMGASRLAGSDAEAGKQLAADGVAALQQLEFDSERIRDVLVDLEGTLRRLNLVGSKMELQGALIDGSEFDWEAYRGKVVLVDYWATWCGPCRAELPNVKKMYAAYHDKGFDVVGISLDTSREKTEQFLEQQEIPWVTLYGVDEESDGWDHPMALRYGISGIPTAILVDQNGVGVHLRARGKTLQDQLQELLGDPLEPATDDAEEDSPAGDEAA